MKTTMSEGQIWKKDSEFYRACRPHHAFGHLLLNTALRYEQVNSPTP